MPNVVPAAPAVAAQNVPIKSIAAPAPAKANSNAAKSNTTATPNAPVNPNAANSNAAAKPKAPAANATTPNATNDPSAPAANATKQNAPAKPNATNATNDPSAPAPNATNKNASANSNAAKPNGEDPAAANKAFEEEIKDMLVKYDVSTDKLKDATIAVVYLKALRYKQLVELSKQGKSEFNAKLEGIASGSEKTIEADSDPSAETTNKIAGTEKELSEFIVDKHNLTKLLAFTTKAAYDESIKADTEALKKIEELVAAATPKVPVAPVNPGAAGGGRRKRRTHRKKSKKSKKSKKTSRRRRSKVPRSA